MSGPQTSSNRVFRIDAQAALDAAGTACFPAAMLVEIVPRPARLGDDLLPVGVPAGRLTVLAIGRPDEVDHHPANAQATRIARPRAVLVPGMVNAHTHLDLTHIGPIPPCDFPAFVDRVRAGRAKDEAEITASVRAGVKLCLQGGVVAVGDIAGAHQGKPSLAAWEALRDSPLAGVGFIEFFAIGSREHAALANLDRLVGEGLMQRRLGAAQLGLQPHAPYSVSPRAYLHAAELAKKHNLLLATHLAESPAERRFVTFGDGPQVDLLKAIGVWDENIRDWAGRGQSPVAIVEHFLASSPLAVHLNDLDDRDIERLTSLRVIAAYCPRSSAFFQSQAYFGRHRLADLWAAGVRTVLGTDSILNLPVDSAHPGGEGLDVLAEAATVVRARQASALETLGMVTLNGARALGLDYAGFMLSSGSRPLGVVAVESLDGVQAGSAIELWSRALQTQSKTELLLFGN